MKIDDTIRIPPISVEELEASMKRMGEHLRKLRNTYYMSESKLEFPNAVKNALKELHIHDECAPNDLYQYLAQVHGITVQNIRHILGYVYISGFLHGKGDPP